MLKYVRKNSDNSRENSKKNHDKILQFALYSKMNLTALRVNEIE